MRCAIVSSLIAAAAFTATGHAGIASAIFAQTGPKAVAPGMGGGLSFTSFDRPYRSLNGNWIITATVSTGVTATDEVVYTGSGTVGTFRVQEGVTAVDAGRIIDSGTIDTRVAINDAGNFVLTGNLSGATTDDEVIIRGFAGGGFDVPVREGSSIGTPPTFTGPVTLGTTQDSPNIANSDAVAYRASAFTGGGTTTSTNNATFRNANTLTDIRTNTIAPTNLPGRNYDTLAAGDYFVDASGNNWLANTGVTGTTTDDGVIVVNGAAVIREGVTTFGGGTASTFGEAGMDPSGLWWVRGSNSSTTGSGDWVAAGDTTGAYSVVALTDDPITPGNTELWDDATFAANFFLFAQNNSGDYIVGGTTNAANLNANAVLVYNGVLEIMREGDQVDLDGNGILDDDAYIFTFNNDDCFLDGDEFYFTSNLVNGAGTALGQAFLHITVPAPGAAAMLALGGLLAARRRR